MTEPAWITTLREAVRREGYETVERKIEYSRTSIDAVLKGTYGASTDRVQASVEGAYRTAQVRCPVIGDMLGREICIQEQRRRLGADTELRARFRRTCPTCAHFMPQKKGGDNA